MKRFPSVVLLSLIGALVLVLEGSLVNGALASPNDSRPGMMGSSGSRPLMGSLVRSPATARSLTINQAQHQVQLYIKQYGKSHLVIDEIMEFQQNFYAIVKDTTTGHGAFEVLVNKWSGLVFPEYGPAMMWNTQYGTMRNGMGGMMGYRYRSSPMTISSAQAATIARQWLARNRPGTAAESPDQFPGYYTVHFRRGGTIAGMLSVNGYTGQVWFHTWHGKFIRMKEVHG